MEKETDNLIGKKFNRLLITKRISNKIVECRCDCGKIKKVALRESLRHMLISSFPFLFAWRLTKTASAERAIAIMIGWFPFAR